MSSASSSEAPQRPEALPASEARAKGEMLLKACQELRAEDALQLVSEGANVDFADEFSETPLMRASIEGLEAVAARLVEAGAALDLVGLGGNSALMFASSNGHTAVVQLLADRGAALDLVDKEGLSALMWASLQGHAAVAQLLADRGAKLDLVDEDGCSALIVACSGGHAAAAQLLAARMDAAALNLVDSTRKTALDHANEGGEGKDKVAELEPAAAAIRARGGLTGAEIAART
jgi:ankyrin repeat protein